MVFDAAFATLLSAFAPGLVVTCTSKVNMHVSGGHKTSHSAQIYSATFSLVLCKTLPLLRPSVSIRSLPSSSVHLLSLRLQTNL